jgi:hypothetical protein
VAVGAAVGGIGRSCEARDRVEHVLSRDGATLDVRVMMPCRQCHVSETKGAAGATPDCVYHLRVLLPSPNPTVAHESRREQVVLLIVALYDVTSPTWHRVVSEAAFGRRRSEDVRQRGRGGGWRRLWRGPCEPRLAASCCKVHDLGVPRLQCSAHSATDAYTPRKSGELNKIIRSLNFKTNQPYDFCGSCMSTHPVAWGVDCPRPEQLRSLGDGITTAHDIGVGGSPFGGPCAHGAASA